MSKFASFAEYPARSLVGAEAALLTDGVVFLGALP